MRTNLTRALSVTLVPVCIALALAGCGTSNNPATNTGNTPASNATSNAASNSTASTASKSVPPSTVVATYKGGQITAGEFDKYLNVITLVNPQANTSSSAAKTQILQQYIGLDKILAAQANKAGFTLTNTKVKSDVTQFKSQLLQQVFNNSTQSYNQKLQSLHLTDTDVTNAVGNEFAVEEYAASLIPASDAQAYYKQHLTSYTLTTQHGILVKTQADAEKVYGLLQKDHSTANWDKLAKQYSQDPGSKDNGGLYSNQPASNWVPQYATAVTTQPIGQVGKPFNTTYGWFVVEVMARTVQPFSSVKSQVEGQMLSDSTSKYSVSKLVSQAQSQANIKVTLPS